MKDAESLGIEIDRLDAMVHAMKLPMPPATHLSMLKATLPHIVTALRALYVAETGENPWETHP